MLGSKVFSVYNMGRHSMKLSVRTVICVLASLVVLICFSSVYGHRVSADSTVVESGSLWNCNWELDADGNLYVICKANTLGLGYLISNVQNEVKTVTFDLSGVDSSYGITINGSGADVSSISFADTEFIVDSVYLENFTTVDEDHISIPDSVTVIGSHAFNYCVELKEIDGEWYYFYDSGAMAHDTTIDGYELDSNGVWAD